MQMSRMPQVQGIKATAVVIYRKALITKEMRYHRLSWKVNNTAKKLFSLDYTNGSILWRFHQLTQAFHKAVRNIIWWVVYATIGIILLKMEVDDENA